MSQSLIREKLVNQNIIDNGAKKERVNNALLELMVLGTIVSSLNAIAVFFK